MNRRSFLKAGLVSGAGIAVLGAGAGGWRAHEAGLVVADAAPFEPWARFADARPGDPAGLIAAGILASNPHNTQPWRFALDGASLTLSAETDRHLGAFDPFRREMWIGLGAAIGNVEAAAPGLGFSTGKPTLEDLAENGAGRIRLPVSADPSAVASELAAAIPHRKTNRAPYADKPVDAAVLARAAARAGRHDGARLVTVDAASEAGRAFAAATYEATKAINADQQMAHDGHVWFRANAREVARHRDGVSVPTAGLSPLIATLGQILPEPDAAASAQYWLNSTRDQLDSAAGFGFILVDDLDDRTAQLAAGRLWQKLHLALTLEGLVAQPLNQMPELVDRDRQLGRDSGWRERLSGIAAGDGHATFAFRYGHPGRAVPHSARRPVEWVSA